MGQYYYPTAKKSRSLEQFYSHYFGNGLKLMEHSYVGNEFVNKVLASLADEPGRLCWLGDYADEGDFERLGVDKALSRMMLSSMSMFAAEEDDEENLYLHYSKEAAPDVGGMLVVNRSKKEYVDMKRYEETAPEDQFGMKIHPIPLLTAVGNGKGGGDYRGSNMDLIGRWCCDEIQTAKDASGLEDYKDITEDCAFVEDRQRSN